MGKRVLVVITTGFTKYGGLTSVVMNCVRKMDLNDLSIDIVSGNDPEKDLLEECQSLGIKYYKISGRTKNPLRYYRELKKLLIGYDAIHVHSNSATAAIELMAAKRANVKKRIVQNHTGKCDHAIASAIMKPVFNKLYTDAIACSKKAGEWLFTNREYQVFNNSIDTENYRYNMLSRTRIRAELGIKANTVCLGHVGKIYKPKNHRFLIDIFKNYNEQNTNSRLLLIGDGPMKNEIQQYVHELELDGLVLFLGMRSNVNDYLSAIDIFVFPSLWEGMPLSVIEAQASGLQCFISDTIDSEVCVTNSVKRIPINNGTEIWIRYMPDQIIDNRVVKSDSNITELIKARFDSSVSSKMIKDIYMKSN